MNDRRVGEERERGGGSQLAKTQNAKLEKDDIKSTHLSYLDAGLQIYLTTSLDLVHSSDQFPFILSQSCQNFGTVDKERIPFQFSSLSSFSRLTERTRICILD